MAQRSDRKDPSWLSPLLLAAILLTLSLALVLAYKGWKEDRALHHSDQEGTSEIIADISVNLSGISYREHCMTCHLADRVLNCHKKP